MTIKLVTKNGEEVTKMKTPISTQLLQEQNKNQELQGEINTLQATITKLNKDLESEKSYTKNAREASKLLSDEIEQIHQMLDAVPSPVERESKGEHSWDTIKRSAITRLAAWLAAGSRK